MIGLSPNGVKIMVATKPVDFRKGHDGLAARQGSAASHERAMKPCERCWWQEQQLSFRMLGDSVKHLHG